jgi:hypothetical protein
MWQSNQEEMENKMTDREKIELLRNALATLMYECETNAIFGEDEYERDALNHAENAMELTEEVLE